MSVATTVLAIVLAALVAGAGIAATTIAMRQRARIGTASDRAALAAELIKLEEELGYAEAYAEPGSATAANLARAHAELNIAFGAYNHTSSVDGENLSVRDGNAIAERLAVVRSLLNTADQPGGPSGAAGSTVLATRANSVIVNTDITPVVSTGSRVFEVALWVLGVVPGAVFSARKTAARNYFRALAGRINANAAQIDVFLERRLQILRTSLPSAAIEGTTRNTTNGEIDRAYQTALARLDGGTVPPSLAAALRADRTVQREIAAARTLYNDTVNQWNSDIFAWPVKMIVAAEQELTTKPVFVASQVTSALNI
jgi:LemA protein